MFNFFKKKPPSTFGNSSQNSKLIDTVISPNVNLFAVINNEIVKDVYIYILKKFNIIEPTLNYESKYIYTFRLLRKEKEFLLGNTMGNIGYLINRTRILRGIPSQLSQNM